MLASNTDITYERARGNANSIKNCASNMSNIFDEFNSSMSTVGSEDIFYGNASDSLTSSYSTFKTKFDEFVGLVNDFSNVILKAVDATEATEENLKRGAQNL